MSDLEIKQTRFGAPAARTLVAAAQADLATRYGESDQSPVEAIEFDPPEGGFFLAYLGGQPVACAGWRTLSHFYGDESEFGDDVAEIKRMYASPTVRGTGVATSLLTAVEDAARTHGMRRIVLETGRRQPEAMRFYEKHGYLAIPSYGYYKDEPDSVCYSREL